MSASVDCSSPWWFIQNIAKGHDNPPTTLVAKSNKQQKGELCL